MTAKKKLGRNVTVDGVTYGPKDDVPDEVLEKISNPKAYMPLPDAMDNEEPEDPDRPAGTASGHKLATTVSVGGKLYGPKDPIPDDVAEKIKNPKAWAGGKPPTARKTAEDGAKPAEDKAPAKKAAPPASKDA